jgi:glycosyltransferase involved in cell wall biosynthesis
MPEISIVLPVYNGERYLSRAVDSILVQSFQDFELIIVNDCSNDNSLVIAEAFAAKDKRVKIISNDINRRLPASLNIGFAAATGDYFTWTSDDNLLKPNCCRRLLERLQACRRDIVYADAEEIDENDTMLLIRKKNEPLENLAMGNVIGACFLYRKEVHERLGGFKEDLFLIEDYDFWVRCWLKNFTFLHVPEVLYIYRRHSNSLSIQFKEQVNFIHLNYIIKMKKAFIGTAIMQKIEDEILLRRSKFYYRIYPIGQNNCMTEIIKNEPFNLYNYFYAVSHYIEKKEISAAKNILDDILNLFPLWAEGHSLYSYIYELDGHRDLALSAAQKSVDLDADATHCKTRLLNLLKKRTH